MRHGTEEVTVRSKLLGRHNVANLLAAAAVGISLDLPLDAIGRALSQVSPPAHRLAPILNRQAGIVVIDDAYNSNPVGAAAALEVLASHEAQRRLLVTPGMVELGDREAEENERSARRRPRCATSWCWWASSARGRSGPASPPPTSPTTASTWSPTRPRPRRSSPKTTRRGDVVLFENDLPDLYAEDGNWPRRAPVRVPRQ